MERKQKDEEVMYFDEKTRIVFGKRDMTMEEFVTGVHKRGKKKGERFELWKKVTGYHQSLYLLIKDYGFTRFQDISPTAKEYLEIEKRIREMIEKLPKMIIHGYSSELPLVIREKTKVIKERYEYKKKKGKRKKAGWDLVETEVVEDIKKKNKKVNVEDLF